MEERSKLKSVILWNLGIYFAYTIAGLFTVYFNFKVKPAISLAFLLWSFLFMGIHIFFMLITVIVFLAKKEKESAKAFLLGILIILLIGFPVCFSPDLEHYKF